MALKMRDTPKSLFKYFGPDRLDVLLTRKMRFTPLGEFNDPFEGRPHLQGLATAERTLGSFEELLLPELLDTYSRQPPEFRAAISQTKFLNRMVPAMRQSYPVLQKALEAGVKEALEGLPQKWDSYIGALCLSEVCDSLLMWAHYAASHTGFVLEFDAHHPFFHAQRSENDECRHIRRVLYRDARPSGVLLDLEVSDMFLVKSTQWSYEREWRMFMALTEANDIANSGSSKIYLFEVPPDAIIGVVLGARASVQLKEEARGMIQDQSELQHVRIKSCYPDPREFVLRVRESAI
ncbi:DUF2971 domain-containing protein [Novilysobacter selenitireducens]|uniref:DUF2971 domain-containing protein n=1 Tax=Novilysobacter selenitireducens TaxID=2872639 RepID=A0ABS7T5D8_9GAMM|nr:DUF2971 domain-containing protein [Lysobacter selenitireducens]MBZ4039097.1 DUF2971 domain-containing protein [Lysobacter selenitireducens]